MAVVLITGIAGHLGSRLAKWILCNVSGVNVLGVDDLSSGYRENIPSGVEWVEETLGNDPHIEALRDLDYVFHFAAHAAEGRSPFIRCANYRNNLLATSQVVNHCIEHGVKRLVYTSSMAAYGDAGAPFDESATCLPIDPYGNAKLAGERDIEIASEQHGLDYCIIRPHNIYGPYQDIWTPYRNVLGIWMARHLQGLPLRIYGDGLQQRAFSYIDDNLPCLWKAATEPQASRQIINLGGASPVTILEASRIVTDVMCGGNVIHEEPRHEVKEAWCTVQKSIDLLGYDETVGLRDGVRKMWMWARDAWKDYPQRRSRGNFVKNEIETGLYEFWKDLV